MVGAPGDGVQQEEPGRRSPAFRPDRITKLEGDVGYYSVFTPSIAPFKRVGALDGVVMTDGVPALAVSQARLRNVPVEGPDVPAADRRIRDRFWGSVVLDFSEGRTVPLPSVSPESRILSIRTEPEIALSIQKDGADNFYAVAPPLPPEQVRVTFMMDAPRSYFGSELPDAPSDSLASEVFPLPPEVSRDAAKFLEQLGLERGMPVSTALTELARYFRSFVESKEPPADTGNIYLDLARGRRGVCRHRAYGFVISAHALGIPARFVQNEAHAWVEVKVPTRGWLRLDLGGAAHGLVAHGVKDRPAYDAPRDPWPRPPEYVDAERQASEQQQAQAGGGGAGAGGAGAGLQKGGGARAADDRSLKPTLAVGRGRVGGRPAPGDRRVPVRLRLTGFESQVLRGHVLNVAGRADTPPRRSRGADRSDGDRRAGRI